MGDMDRAPGWPNGPFAAHADRRGGSRASRGWREPLREAVGFPEGCGQGLQVPPLGGGFAHQRTWGTGGSHTAPARRQRPWRTHRELMETRDSEHVWDGPTRQGISSEHLPGPGKWQNPSPTVQTGEGFSRTLTRSLSSPLGERAEGWGEAETTLIRPEKEKAGACSRERQTGRVNRRGARVHGEWVSDDPPAPNV